MDRTFHCFKDKLSITTMIFIRSENNLALLQLYVLLGISEHASMEGCSELHIFKQCNIYIRVNNPTLNRNIDIYNLSHLWERVLLNTPGLKIDSSQHPLHLHNNSLAQTSPANSQCPITTGTSENALNSEHAFRDA